MAQSREPRSVQGGDNLLGVQRVFALLRAVASAGGAGMRLSAVAEQTGVHVTTTHRLLRALGRERAVVYDPYTRCYHIGYDFLRQPEDTSEYRLRLVMQPVLQRLADLSHATVYLCIRRGSDALFIACGQPPQPGPSVPLEVGSRRPLGAGNSGTVLLAALPAREASAIVDANVPRYARYNASASEVRARLRACRADGYSFSLDNIEKGVGGIALPVHSPRGGVIAGLSFVAENACFSAERRGQLLAWARRELEQVAPMLPEPSAVWPLEMPG